MKIKTISVVSGLALAVLASTAHAVPTTYGFSQFNSPIDAGIGSVTVSADVNYLSLKLQVADTTDARLGENTFGNDQMSLNIGPSAAQWGNPYDLIFQTSADLPWGPTSSGTIDGWNTQWSLGGVQQLALPFGLQTVTTYDGTDRHTEWLIPLASLNLSAGDTLKIGGSIEMGNAAGNPSYVWPIGLDFNMNQQNNTFAEITVSGAAAVPEPGTLALVALSLTALGLSRRRKVA